MKFFKELKDIGARYDVIKELLRGVKGLGEANFEKSKFIDSDVTETEFHGLQDLLEYVFKQ